MEWNLRLMDTSNTYMGYLSYIGSNHMSVRRKPNLFLSGKWTSRTSKPLDLLFLGNHQATTVAKLWDADAWSVHRLTLLSLLYSQQNCKQVHQFNPHWPETFNAQKFSQGPMFYPFHFTISPFRDIGDQFCKCIEQHDLKHFKSKNTLCALNICPLGSHICPLCYITSHFRDTKLRKIANVPTDLRKHITVKGTMFTLNTTRGPHFLFVLLYNQSYQDRS